MKILKLALIMTSVLKLIDYDMNVDKIIAAVNASGEE